MKDLNILICTIPDRRDQYNTLLSKLKKQIGASRHMVSIYYNSHPSFTIGKKRNWLLKQADCDYLCFIDDDDDIADDYIDTLLNAIKQKPDCVSLKGVITWKGERPEVFEHSIRYHEYKNNPEGSPVRYERYPNHLNCIKSNIAKQFKFPEINFGEDSDWATQLHQSGLLNKEVYIDKILYYYKYTK